MKRRKKVSLAEEFNQLNFHDDVLTSVGAWISKRGKIYARVDLAFRDDSTHKGKLLSFIDCANLRVVMDFDVLSDNWFAPTDASTAKTDLGRMRRFVLVQKAHWHTKYVPPAPSNLPIRKKLSTIH